MQTVKKELWNAQVGPDSMQTSAVEWPTLRSATTVTSIMKGPRRDSEDEWGGKVWDGVTEWFM